MIMKMIINVLFSSLFIFISTAAAAVVRGSIRRLRELADI